MEDRTIVPAVDSEDIRDSFICCVCLDLLYKPIVLSCGHMACFWCVYGSMSNLSESHCPICRHSYYHFPTICEMFHYLLLKLYPLTYKRREKQIMEEEKKHGLFSPQFDGHASALIADKDCNHMMDSANSCTTTCESNTCLWPSSATKDPNANVEQLESISVIQGNDITLSQHVSGESFEVQKAFTSEKEDLPQNELNENCKQISIADLLCFACKQLLLHPVVLNCGHVYCENCIINPVDQMIRCKVCNSSHPGGSPKVCLELAEFLKEQFPKDYALRIDTVQQKQANFENESQTTIHTKTGKEGVSLSSVPARENPPWWAPSLKIHIGAGCDFCGFDRSWKLARHFYCLMIDCFPLLIYQFVLGMPLGPITLLRFFPIQKRSCTSIVVKSR
ncbi:hypothetical protein HS088_TW06G00499 [Tripterygium wilfordii]|uniref:RING-type domain-containing protein n=1 Tax=Tripterygium wilfordii TaxID=458696 RepID=A0A7J7DJ49_TRIWF|nr:E3 ubiquitin-protein ligase PRT1-like isoform X2 [Tripterygium wilfordii]KAF5746328.1 hypothetical protein HS088_TW06G00499 [Tripterygium wilfordii]